MQSASSDIIQSGDQQSSAYAQPAQGAPILILLVAGLVVPAILAYALGTVSEMRVLAVVIALVGALTVLARPFWGLILFVALLYTRPEEAIPELAGTRLTLGMSLLTLVAMYFQMVLNRQPMTRTPVAGLFVAWGVWAALGALPYGTWEIAAQELGRLVILVLLILNLVRTPAQYRAFASAVILFTAYLAGYSIQRYFTGGALVRTDWKEAILQTQATGIFGDPNDLAATIVAGLALVFIRFKASQALMRWVYAALGGLFLWAIFLTNSRGGMLALLTVVGGYILVTSRKKALAFSCIPLVLGLILVVSPARMTNFDSDDGSANSRFWYWHAGLMELKANPVMGVGYGRFMDINGGMTAHNSFVLCFTELGLPGYLLWMGCLYYGFRRRKQTGDADPPVDRTDARLQELQALAASPPRGSPDMELLGSRLALAGFLMGAFWISRTYTPIMVLIMVLPTVAQTACAHGPDRPEPITWPRAVDWARIAGVSIASIVFIKAMTDFYK
jgi:putative inorganic carbon (hco3(-)) transporter